ncbi:helix-turn-helix transcriptional regulator [Pantoea sp.]|jgi:phage repressor protein C with HTH and peptisase S24 domain|uniref:XRE family transcriptional regulator n=1 Tax=Pantoea sp. TaxID=69393 RepID=UPI0031D1252D
MKMTLAERLKLAMREVGLTQTGLADRVGVSQAAIQKLTSGKASSSTKLIQIAEALGVSAAWLADETGPMYVSSKGEHHPASTTPPLNDWYPVDPWDKNTPLEDDEIEIPFLKDIEFACGDGTISDEDYNGFMLRFSKSTMRRSGVNTDGSGVLCFPAHGNSMEPVIPEGTTVAVNCFDKKVVDGKLYAISQGGWKRLKLLYRTGPDKLGIRSYNSAEYPDEEADMKEVEIIGRVFWSSTLW